jgi:beta-glucosidase
MSDIIFPENFLVGTATSSYQIEGAYNEDGKGESIWDRFSHTTGKTLNDENGDIACDHYHRFKDDLDIMKDIGFKAYRFSLSWPRILPTGRNQINYKGVDFYNHLIDKLLSNNIIPFITLYHWDLPQTLQDMGGWPNRDTAYYFSDYAEQCYNKFGDRVKNWITLNEPFCSAYLGHFTGEHAPGIRDVSKSFASSHNLLLAHGLSVNKFRDSKCKDGEIGISLNLVPGEPYSDKQEDVDITKLFNAISNDMFLEPLYYGKYPEIINDLPFVPVEMSTEDGKIISAKTDFLGINYYSRNVIKYTPRNLLKYENVIPESSKVTDMGWEIYPVGLYKLLHSLKEKYGNPKMYITENGMASKDEITGGCIDDKERIEYLKNHIELSLKARSEGVNLRGYFVWSFMDNFEWAFGYSKRFGLVYIDYKTLKRTLKNSALWLKNILRK